jgi:alcohol dehydrogenase class IV
MRLLALHLELPKPSFQAVLDWILNLRAEFDIPHTVQDIGVDNSRFEQLAAMAVVDPTAAGNPIELSEADCLRLYELSYSGKLEL